ncbi:MAG: T9SS type A sorting domain-containing protein [Bacteroidia bacterium]|nr:T9SS type A sorting domain-containing protein [Bacteroidia bacterium]
MKKNLLILFAALAAGLSSQTQAYLDINNVKALIMNRNDMFWNLASGNASYEVPKNSGKHCNFASSVWLGGLDGGGQLHMAGMTYRQNGVDFWLGPLDTISGNIDNATSNNFDKVWKVSTNDINSFLVAYANGSITANTYVPTNDILTWPAHGNVSGGYSHYLAPFIDVDNDGIYNPYNGDYPKIKGDQMIFYVCNDKKSSHTETQGVALGVEIQVSAYAYNCPAVLASYPELNNTTFYNYKVFNRSSIQYNSTMVGIWSDVDLGNYTDDYIGCDPQASIGYAYNADSLDGSYGNFPPITSYQVLKGPLANPMDAVDNNHNGLIDEPMEDTRFNNFMYYNNNIGAFPPQTNNPGVAIHYYNYMRSIWLDGSPLKGDSTGYLYGNSSPAIPYAYPGNPQLNTGWNEYTKNNLKGDRRFIIGNGPFTFLPNAVFEMDFSVLTTFDSSATGHKNIAKMKNQNAVVKNFYDLANKPSCIALVSGISETMIEKINVSIVPNPASDLIYIYSSKDLTNSEIKLYNSLGQVVFSDKILSETYKVNLKDLSNGLYIVEIKGDHIFGNSKMIKN